MAVGKPSPVQFDLAPPYGHSHLVRRRTSKWSVACLVVSFGWIVVPRGTVWAYVLVGGVAVILGVVAIRTISRSNGQERGMWMAIVGIVIGAFFSVALLAVYLITPPPVPLGTTVYMSHKGVHSVSVISFQFPVSRDDHPGPTSGTEYAVAHVRTCAGKSGSQSNVASFIELHFSNGRFARPDLSVSVKKPTISMQGLRSDACADGYLTYEVTRGLVPNIIQYQDLFETHRWTVPTDH